MAVMKKAKVPASKELTVHVLVFKHVSITALLTSHTDRWLNKPETSVGTSLYARHPTGW